LKIIEPLTPQIANNNFNIQGQLERSVMNEISRVSTFKLDNNTPLLFPLFYERIVFCIQAETMVRACLFINALCFQRIDSPVLVPVDSFAFHCIQSQEAPTAAPSLPQRCPQVWARCASSKILLLRGLYHTKKRLKIKIINT